MASKAAYAEMLKDPRWQKKRLEILQRDGWTCQECGAKEETLHVHHLFYEFGRAPWDYEGHWLLTLCEGCHEKETAAKKQADAELRSAMAGAKFRSWDLEMLARLVEALVEVGAGDDAESSDALRCLTALAAKEGFLRSAIDAVWDWGPWRDGLTPSVAWVEAPPLPASAEQSAGA